jgi:uncharacterized protein (DUF849 family)
MAVQNKRPTNMPKTVAPAATVAGKTAKTVAAKTAPVKAAPVKAAIAKTAAVKSAPVKAAAAKTAAVKPEAAKPAVAVKAVPAVVAVKESKGEKHKKLKMVRDSFTMPVTDYAHIAALKERCLKAGVSAKKSELLRAALIALSKLNDKALIKAIADLAPIKTGRPVKG